MDDLVGVEVADAVEDLLAVGPDGDVLEGPEALDDGAETAWKG